MKRTFFIYILLSLTLSGCKTPQYRTQMLSYTENPTVSSQQAEAICVPKANLAADQAATNLKQQILQNRNNNKPTYCHAEKTGYNTATATCRKGGYADFGDALQLNEQLEVNRVYKGTRNTVLNSCIAEQGWYYQQYCAANCRK